MKKLLSLLLALALALTLTACSGSSESEEGSAAVTAAGDLQESAQPAPAETGTAPAEDETPEETDGADAPAASQSPAQTPAPSQTPAASQKPAASAAPSAAPAPSQSPTSAASPSMAPSASPTPTPAASAPDLAAFYSTMTTGRDFPAMMEMEGDYLESCYPGLTAISRKQTAAYLPMISAVACEVALVEVSSAADVQKVKDIFQARIDAQVDGGAWYPETIEQWENNARIAVNGNCVMLIVHSDSDAIVGAFQAL